MNTSKEIYKTMGLQQTTQLHIETGRLPLGKRKSFVAGGNSNKSSPRYYSDGQFKRALGQSVNEIACIEPDEQNPSPTKL